MASPMTRGSRCASNPFLSWTCCQGCSGRFLGQVQGVSSRHLYLLLALSLAACGVVDGSQPVESQPSASTVGTTFAEDVQLAEEKTEDFWKQQFTANSLTYQPITRFVPYTGTHGPACGTQPSVPNNAFYCPAGHFIAYDEGWLNELWSRLGDGSVYVILPHEIGHSVQEQLGTRFELNVQQELQADCYAGAALGGLVKASVLLPEANDNSELLTNLASAGDPTDDWFNPEAHGTAEQRQNSFADGYDSGTSAC